MDERSAATIILRAIHSDGPVSRARLARSFGLSPATVSLATRELIAAGLVTEHGQSQEGMGRPATMLTICSGAAYFVGASITPERIRGVLTDLHGTVLAEGSASPRSSDPADVAERLAALSDRLRARAGLGESRRLAGLGVALSGLVDARSGTCIRSTVLGWQDVPIAAELQRRLGLPVSVENDANAVAVGQRLFRAPGLADDFAVVSIGQGVGAGLFVSGRIFAGSAGAAGEIGHCTVDRLGPQCACGKRGCLEAVASVPAMVAEAAARGVPVRSYRDLVRLAGEGESTAKQVLAEAGAAIGLALSHLVNLFGPLQIIVTGSGVRLGRDLQEAVRSAMEAEVFPILPEPPQLLFRDEGALVWARGAASIAMSTYLDTGGSLASSVGSVM